MRSACLPVPRGWSCQSVVRSAGSISGRTAPARGLPLRKPRCRQGVSGFPERAITGTAAGRSGAHVPEDERHVSVSFSGSQEYFGITVSGSGIAVHWAATLAGHHGAFPSLAPHASSRPGVGPAEPWPALRRCLLNELLRVLAPRLEGRTFPTAAWSNAFLMQLAGLCSTADWIGSTEEFFPAAAAETPTDEYWGESRHRAGRALEALGGHATAPTGPQRTFGDLFPHCRPLRPLQEAAVAAADLNPDLVILEAPMGEGKTEAAFYLAERWRSARRQRGAYTALPTQATSNQCSSASGVTLGIAPDTPVVDYPISCTTHAVFSEEYGRIRVGRSLRRPPEEVDGCATRWFQAARNAGCSPAYAGVRHGGTRRCSRFSRHRPVSSVLFRGSAGKTVIFDEIHAYDLYMDELLDAALSGSGHMGCTWCCSPRDSSFVGDAKALLSAQELYHTLTYGRWSYPRFTPPSVRHSGLIAPTVHGRERHARWRLKSARRTARPVASRRRESGCRWLRGVILHTRSALRQVSYRALRTVLRRD